MNKIFISLRNWLRTLTEVDSSPDPLAAFTPAELADLPVTHLDR
jgi:hypothetical protein